MTEHSWSCPRCQRLIGRNGESFTTDADELAGLFEDKGTRDNFVLRALTQAKDLVQQVGKLVREFVTDNRARLNEAFGEKKVNAVLATVMQQLRCWRSSVVIWPLPNYAPLN